MATDGGGAGEQTQLGPLTAEEAFLRLAVAEDKGGGGEAERVLRFPFSVFVPSLMSIAKTMLEQYRHCRSITQYQEDRVAISEQRMP